MPSEVTFKQVVDERYRPRRWGKLIDSLADVRNGYFDHDRKAFVGGCGVSIGTLRAAYHGTVIKKEQALDIVSWGSIVHHVQIDIRTLLLAPSAPTRAGRRRRDGLLSKLTVLDVGVADAADELLVRLRRPDNDVAPSDVFYALEEHMQTLRPRERR